jgi:serine/threonine-protein kinase
VRFGPFRYTGLDDVHRGNPKGSSDATLPPLSSERGLLCPRCHYTVATVAADSPPPRCPEHGLLCVAGREIVITGGDPLLGTNVAGRFTIVARLGTGAMGAVYRARQESLGTEVALKVVRRDRPVDDDTRMRFLREARAMSMLTSPHTRGVLDFGEAEDGSWFLAMELLEGETLGERLRRVGRLTPAVALSITRQALLSLAEAHAKGVVHRDLKPDNLFLVKAAGVSGLEHCKVLYFGIAKIARDEEGAVVDPVETQTGTVFGTPRYMSPEQATGGTLDLRSDLYSLGVILYQMLAGRAPFVDDDAVVVMARHVREQPPALSAVAPDLAVPARIEALVRRALSKKAEDRPQCAAEFITELDAVLEDPEEAASGPHATSWATASQRSEVPQSAPPRARGLRTAVAIGATTAAVTAGLVIFQLLGSAGVPRSVNSAVAAPPKPAGVVIQPQALAQNTAPAPSARDARPGASSSLLAKIPGGPATKPASKPRDRNRKPAERAGELGR